jgi:transcriptional regulator with PAS, ATPase and Fis domain
LKEAELHAASDVPVLISGESGTGKDLLARAIHQASPRAGSPFIAVNMAAVSSSLFDAEFFGHARGAFTGAEKDHPGFLEHAKRGTLFLDEIGNLPYELQGKLLRVLQEGEYVKLGTGKTRKTEARFIAATNEDLQTLLARGVFRKDLYYRLKGASLHLPPLRERREDIPLLTNYWLAELSDVSRRIKITEEAVQLLSENDYPGNIRELRYILLAAANLATDGCIAVHHLPDYFRKRRPAPFRPRLTESEQAVSIAEVEKAHILKTYAQTGENKSQTARLLGIGVNTLRRKLESYGLK